MSIEKIQTRRPNGQFGTSDYFVVVGSRALKVKTLGVLFTALAIISYLVF